MMANRVGDKLIKCEICGVEKKAKAMKAHIRMVHGEGHKNLIQVQLADAKARIKELESHASSVIPAAAPDTKAVLSDWLDNLTFEAWQMIGQEKGFPPDPPEPLPATLSDVVKSECPKGIYIAVKK